MKRGGGEGTIQPCLARGVMHRVLGWLVVEVEGVL